MNKRTLWTKDFTIITLGTVVSTLGNSLTGFAISLLALDFSGSVFLYVLFMVAYTVPKLIMPLLAGPFLDKFSRRRAIYMLDFISSGIYLLLYVYITFVGFSYPLFITAALLIGSIDSTYSVAYESFYPNVVPEGFYRKAYSMSSMIQTVAAAIVPLSVIVYESVGIGPLFLFDSLSFLVAAIFETRITTAEKHTESAESREGFISRFRGGIKYISSEKGLLCITVYFAITMFASSGSSTIIMPYFRSDAGPGVYYYMLVMGCAIVGRFAGSMFQYHHKYKAERRFFISMVAYVAISIIDGTYLYMPIIVMCFMNLFAGMLGSTSYNLRISATQEYVPDHVRARFTGEFQMLCTFGTIGGQLLGGALADYFPIRYIVSGFMGLNLISAFAIMFSNREKLKPIYNRSI